MICEKRLWFSRVFVPKTFGGFAGNIANSVRILVGGNTLVSQTQLRTPDLFFLTCLFEKLKVGESLPLAHSDLSLIAKQVFKCANTQTVINYVRLIRKVAHSLSQTSLNGDPLLVLQGQFGVMPLSCVAVLEKVLPPKGQEIAEVYAQLSAGGLSYHKSWQVVHVLLFLLSARYPQAALKDVAFLHDYMFENKAHQAYKIRDFQALLLSEAVQEILEQCGVFLTI
ncbi:hypothetical protein [Helicobacter suis]|uniref:hypothetical protein n=1 Tax=Helicobacter suis TaxID=104628 RepID=UPI000CF1274A|nr:hypothetical protein [Helicobacter suis]